MQFKFVELDLVKDNILSTVTSFETVIYLDTTTIHLNRV